jgi:nitroreductase
MELENAIRERFSARDFADRPVPASLIIELLEKTALAPSAVNYQPWHFIVISEKETLTAIWPVYHRAWIREAPVIIVACVNHHESWKRSSDGHDFGEVDVAIAVDHLTLVATSAGLGTCWVCNFDAAACKKILKLPEHMQPLVLVPLGYPVKEPPRKIRKPISETVSWEEFGKQPPTH